VPRDEKWVHITNENMTKISRQYQCQDNGVQHQEHNVY